jgi:NADP-dependent 3-hydroxy acid dehydrogenase YdfG
MIDGVFARENFADIDERLSRDSILRPEEIAKTYLFLHQQQRSAWTHEMDLRPWSESW